MDTFANANANANANALLHNQRKLLELIGSVLQRIKHHGVNSGRIVLLDEERMRLSFLHFTEKLF